MRIALVVMLALALAACGKKKSPQAPASGSTESEMSKDAEEKSSDAPAEADDAPTTRSADPQEGGE